MEFEWDPEKADGNATKHGVSFLDAAEVFSDPLSLMVPDPDGSQGEYRYLIFGRTPEGNHLVVSYTEREARIRIISARQMTPRERRAYEQ